MCNFRSIRKVLQYLKFLIFLLIENTFCLFSLRKKSFAGEIVLITGSANGIGKQVALKLAPLGVTLVLWDIDDEGNKETSRLAQQKGAGRVFVYHCDCSNRQDVYEQADKVRKEVGDVTILINNAGVLTGKKFCDLTDEDFEKTFRINFFSQVWTCKAFLPAMVACNRGHLVSTASGGGLIGSCRMSDQTFPLALTMCWLIYTFIMCTYFIKRKFFLLYRKPCLFPVYDPEYAASRIVDAIKKEKFYLIMPPAVYALVTLFLESSIKFPESMEEAFGQKKKD
uniref:Epidermal retinol dehydrogenase 2 n=1 Tax=Malurus cyaneus samueli TaxID=2593467 RepID=A0A8C5TA69_9PASS